MAAAGLGPADHGAFGPDHLIVQPGTAERSVHAEQAGEPQHPATEMGSLIGTVGREARNGSQRAAAAGESDGASRAGTGSEASNSGKTITATAVMVPA